MDILTKLPETETTAAATTAGRSYQPPPAMDSEKVDELEEIIGYKFNDRNLIEQAMTHPSFVRGNRNSSYDRLEYLGDSIISVLFTKLHYFEYSNFSSGHLTPLRASNIDSEKLARVAIKHHLHTYLRHNKPLLEDQIKKFSSDILEYPLHSTGLIEVPKVLADIVESTIGAVFVDSNCCFETVWTVFKDILEPIIDAKTLKRHPMTELCEICQKNSLKVKMVDSWAQNSSIHVYVGDKLLGTGTYLLKKEVAQNRAAKSALNNLADMGITMTTVPERKPVTTPVDVNNINDEPRTSTPIAVEKLEETLGYKFNNQSLIEQALTHSSYADDINSHYDRLEYIGDSVLTALFTKLHYFLYPQLSSGRLTPLRASNIDTEKLARAAVRHGLHTYLRHDKPLLQDQIKKFNSEILDYPLHSTGLIEVPKILADIVESTIGAIFVDSNCCFETVWMVLKTLLQPFISIETLKRHPVTELYEMCQKNHLKLKFVDLWVETYTINVYIDDQLVGTASYAPKKEIAQNRAAKCALQNIDTLIDIKSSQI
ncbi:endoribonuclease Dicer homolog 1 isoform X1 [Cannabis sativa]|uniref:RNase III domain-containing protein n=1 Tax=Cannabis sativa TaxID=3483 RepID=A0A7J6HID8_CANSA|nr:endoribonuclease Dicer homolog 1 isoform X1 [Cannabis sativa]KAF4394488.1 hypothetical protein G4B88_018638 [Cannabis sativa]